VIKISLKFIFAGGIVFWLIQKGEIDFSLIAKALDYKLEIMVGFSIFIINVILTAIRWKLILDIKSSTKIPILSAIKLTWIGLFFNTVLPGAVTGDLVKLLYARDIDKNFSKTFLLLSVFMDRVIGLLGLLSLMGIFSIIYYNDIVSISPEVRYMVHANFIIFTSALILLASIFSPTKIQNFLLTLSLNLPLVGERFYKLFEQIWLIGRSRKTVTACLIMSTGTQFLNVFSFWIICSPFFGVPLSFQHAFTFIPLGLVSTAIPITPAGLGIGHAVFGTLFSYFGVSGGASLFNLYFLMTITVNLIGIIAYVTSGKRHTMKEAMETQNDNNN